MQGDLFSEPVSERHDNGSRRRRDGAGDSWANEHRIELGRTYYLNDFDAFMGNIAFAKTGAEELFAEYVPDHYRNKGKVIRRFATVALFDRKKSMASVHGIINDVQLAYYLDLCRVIGQTQPYQPRFFFVVGQESPWQMVEVSTENGELSKTIHTYGKGEWNRVWEIAGLKAMRDRLRKWVEQQ